MTKLIRVTVATAMVALLFSAPAHAGNGGAKVPSSQRIQMIPRLRKGDPIPSYIIRYDALSSGSFLVFNILASSSLGKANVGLLSLVSNGLAPSSTGLLSSILADHGSHRQLGPAAGQHVATLTIVPENLNDPPRLRLRGLTSLSRRTITRCWRGRNPLLSSFARLWQASDVRRTTLTGDVSGEACHSLCRVARLHRLWKRPPLSTTPTAVSPSFSGSSCPFCAPLKGRWL